MEQLRELTSLAEADPAFYESVAEYTDSATKVLKCFAHRTVFEKFAKAGGMKCATYDRIKDETCDQHVIVHYVEIDLFSVYLRAEYTKMIEKMVEDGTDIFKVSINPNELEVVAICDTKEVYDQVAKYTKEWFGKRLVFDEEEDNYLIIECDEPAILEYAGVIDLMNLDE